MLRAALAFFILAIISYIFGATGVAGMSMEIARIFLIVFLVLAVIGAAVGLIGGGGRRKDVI